MRREYNVTDKEPLPPFYENLVFWAPLTEGDLTDHISGATPTTDSGCSVTWIDSKKSYLIDATNAANLKCGLIWQNLNLNLTDGHEATIYAEVIHLNGTSTSAFFAGAPNIINSTEPNTTNYVVIQPNRFSMTIGGDFTKLVCSCPTLDGVNTKQPKFYKNGELFVTVSWKAKTKLSRNIVCAVCNFNQDYQSRSLAAYIRDIRLYNRALTAQEVAQL